MSEKAPTFRIGLVITPPTSSTFRLGDSLPQQVLQRWQAERDDIVKHARQMNRPLSDAEIIQIHELHLDKVETYLDAGHGACWLHEARIANLVAGAIRYFDSQRYRLHAWSIMPNHAHVVVEPIMPFELPKIMHSWKSFTANEANKILNQHGHFWQVESYDHLIRDEADYYHCVEYTYTNPERAGLFNWPWCWWTFALYQCSHLAHLARATAFHERNHDWTT